MGHAIIKPSPAEDFYFVWSSNTDCPIGHGTRTDMMKISWLGATTERMDRADQLGSSDIHNWMGWEEKEFLIHEIGTDLFTVKRSNMKAFCESLDYADPSKFDASLTEPFEWED